MNGRQLIVDAKEKWLKGCLVCNLSLCQAIDELVEKTGYTPYSVCQIMAQESDGLYTHQQLKQRYMYHHAKSGRNSTVMQKEDINQARHDLNNEILLSTPEKMILDTEVVDLTKTLKNTAMVVKKFLAFLGTRGLDRDENGGLIKAINAMAEQLMALLPPLGYEWVGELKDLQEQEMRQRNIPEITVQPRSRRGELASIGQEKKVAAG